MRGRGARPARRASGAGAGRLAAAAWSVGAAWSIGGVWPTHSAAEDRPASAEEVSAFAFQTDARVRREIDLTLVRKGLPLADPRDGIPAIRRPTVVAAGAAAHLRDDDAVVGLAVGGDVRAYAIRILDRHEVVNDVVGGLPVAVTYCPLCDTAVAFRRDLPRDPSRADEAPPTFGVSGYLYESDVLLYDRPADAPEGSREGSPAGRPAETFWAQAIARGVVGPRTGVQLERLPVTRTTWRAWRAAHAGTTALGLASEHRFPPEAYALPSYVEYRSSRQLMFPVKALDSRLPKKTVVHGLSVGTESLAVPAGALSAERGSVPFSLGGRRVRMRTDPVTGDLRAETLRDAALEAGRSPKSPDAPDAPDAPERSEAWVEIPVLRAYWFAWAAFHPATTIWALPAGEEAR